MSIGQWWPIGHRIDLGGTVLEIIATPGHSPDSISLHDRGRGLLLSADFLYLGNLYGQRPGASLPDYLKSAEALGIGLDRGTLILGAHGEDHPSGAPKLSLVDLADFKRSLMAIRDRTMPPTGQSPDRYVINKRLALLVSPQSYGSWRSGQGG